MLQQINNLTSSIESLKKDLKIYELDSVTSITAFSRIKKAFLKSAPYIKTDQDFIDCKITFYGSLQKLKRLGIDLNDLDSWFINNYKSTITAQYQYQALLRSAAKKGYICLPTIYYLLPEEEFYTQRDENNIIRIYYKNTGIKKNISLDSIKDYRNFFILMDVYSQSKLLHQVELFLPPEEILERKNKSNMKDKGEIIKKWNKQLNRYEEIENPDQSVWETWTRSMIDKTLVLAACKMIKESIPALGEVFKFEDLEEDEEEKEIEIKGDSVKTEFTPKEAPLLKKDVDLNNPSQEIINQAKKIQEEYALTPELKQFNRELLSKKAEEVSNSQEKKHFFNTNAHLILSLDPEIKDRVLQKISYIEENNYKA